MNNTHVALVVEDDKNTAIGLSRMLEGLGYSVHVAASLEQALIHRDSIDPSVVLLDLGLPDGSGLALLQDEVKAGSESPNFIVITGDDTQAMAINCLRAGAHDLLTKPVSLTELRTSIGKLGEPQQSSNDESHPVKPLDCCCYESDPQESVVLLGKSKAAQTLRDAVSRCASSRLNTVVIGDVGAGRQEVAFEIHQQSERDGKCLLVHGSELDDYLSRQNEPTAPKSMMNNERPKTHLRDITSADTLVIEDISAIGWVNQKRFIAFLDNNLNRRDQQKDTLRIIATVPNQTTIQKAEGRINPDLYYRLSKFIVPVPSLNERKDDIPEIAAGILSHIRKVESRTEAATVHPLGLPSNYTWPGNIRELRNTLEQYVAEGETGKVFSEISTSTGASISAEPGDKKQNVDTLVGSSFWHVEELLLNATLDYTGGDKQKAAEMLGISLKTLYNRLNAYS